MTRLKEIEDQVLTMLGTEQYAPAKQYYKKYTMHYAARALPEPMQLQIADIFYKDQEYNMAAEALDRYLRFYPQGQRRDVVLVKLGFLHSRHLRRYATAQRYLQWALNTIDHEGLRAKTEQELKRLADYFKQTAVEDLTGNCAIIRQTDDAIDITQVGPQVAAIIGKPRADVTTLLKGSRGFVAMDVPASKARAAAEVLQNMGIPVLIVPMERLVGLPPAMLINSAAFDAKGGYFLRGETKTFHAWENIYLIAAGQVLERDTPNIAMLDSPLDDMVATAKLQVSRPGVMLWSGALEHEQRRTKILERIFIDILIYQPWSRYRINSEFFRYNLMKAHASDEPANLSTLCHHILQFSKDVRENEAVEALAYKKSLAHFTFDGQNKFDLYISWLLQLEEWKMGYRVDSADASPG